MTRVEYPRPIDAKTKEWLAAHPLSSQGFPGERTESLEVELDCGGVSRRAARKFSTRPRRLDPRHRTVVGVDRDRGTPGPCHVGHVARPLPRQEEDVAGRIAGVDDVCRVGTPVDVGGGEAGDGAFAQELGDDA